MKKNAALLAMAEGLEKAEEAILEANKQDLLPFEEDKSRAAMADRLKLTPKRIADMAKQILKQVQQGAELLKVMRGYSSVTYLEDGAIVTHGEVRFKDLK